MARDPTPVTLPFPISRIAGRYLLFDVDVIGRVRRTHNINGVFIGTVPNLSQQNVFLGIPMELQPEEARVLVEQGHAYVVDDAALHREGLLKMGRKERLQFLEEMDRQGMEIAKHEVKEAEKRADEALEKRGLTRKKKVEHTVETITADMDDTSLFESAPAKSNAVTVFEKKIEPVFITPTTSYPPLSRPSPDSALPLPDVPRSYPLFRHLHSKGYFMMPGIRFGCHYSAYPGDTLRFHSHYLATGLEWDEEFSLQDIIGGGRLANRVKKAYLIGGEVEDEDKEADTDQSPVRAFSIEWAGL
jgi:tRNA-splicing endonuclease subunit Sen34